MIRKFLLGDATECSKIIYSCVNLSKDLTSTSKNNVIKQGSPKNLMKKSKTGIFVVYLRRNKILGMGRLVRNEIKRMYVSPEYQGKGIGSSILKYLENYAKKKGIKNLRLYTHPYADKFYSKNSYRVTQKGKNRGQVFIKMEKKLV